MVRTNFQVSGVRHVRAQEYPQLLDHRPYRPRQVHPGRPADPGHAARSTDREMTRPGARQHGYRARARHHHQGADRPPDLHGQGRRDLRAQPDGHAGPCRLRLRGQPQSSPPAKARCWWSTPARASRRRRSPTSTRRSRHNHEIVPVLNKIDLPAAEPERVKQQIEDVIGLDASDAVEISAKTGLNIERRAGGVRAAPAATQGRPRRAAEGAAGR